MKAVSSRASDHSPISLHSSQLLSVVDNSKCDCTLVPAKQQQQRLLAVRIRPLTPVVKVVCISKGGGLSQAISKRLRSKGPRAGLGFLGSGQRSRVPPARGLGGRCKFTRVVRGGSAEPWTKLV